MVRFYSENLLYEIRSVSESQVGNSILFEIEKTVFGDNECTNSICVRNFTKRLKVDDNGDVYTARSGKRKWFNWYTQKPFIHYSIM